MCNVLFILINFVMKKMNFEQMETINGGWTNEQHFWCAVGGIVAGGGWGGALLYVACLELLATA